MSSQSTVLQNVRQVDLQPSTHDVGAQPNRTLKQIGTVVISVWLCLAVLIAAVVAGARGEITPQPVDPPQGYLPGNPLPADASCDWSGGDSLFCEVFQPDSSLGQVIYFSSPASNRLIQRSVIRTSAYTLGQLVNAWGTPTGISLNAQTTYIRWGTRSVLLYTTCLHFDSFIDFMVFDLKAPSSLPWHGFTCRHRQD